MALQDYECNKNKNSIGHEKIKEKLSELLTE